MVRSLGQRVSRQLARYGADFVWKMVCCKKFRIVCDDCHFLLDDGREATVICRNGDHYSGPIIHYDAAAENTILAIHESHHKIVRPLVDKRKREMRIMPDMMDSLTLDMLQPGC